MKSEKIDNCKRKIRKMFKPCHVKLNFSTFTFKKTKLSLNIQPSIIYFHLCWAAFSLGKKLSRDKTKKILLLIHQYKLDAKSVI